MVHWDYRRLYWWCSILANYHLLSALSTKTCSQPPLFLPRLACSRLVANLLACFTTQLTYISSYLYLLATRNSGIRPPAPPLGRPSQRRGIPTAEENVSPFTADQNSFHGASTLASDLKRERMHTSDAIAIESTASPTTSASHQISSQSTSHLQDFLATNPSTDPGYLADESMPDNEPPAYERLSTYLHPQAPRLTS